MPFFVDLVPPQRDFLGKQKKKALRGSAKKILREAQTKKTRRNKRVVRTELF